MMIDFAYATERHIDWLKSRDHHISEATLGKKVSAYEILIAEIKDQPLGWLRFGFFWDSIPFMNMLVIEAADRGNRIGARLVSYWESEMAKENHAFVMTSSQSNEDAQHFYRKLGYADSGSLNLPGEPVELLFIKDLRKLGNSA